MNYGYFEKNKELKLNDHDEKNRYALQLYHLLATSVQIQNKDILEVGSGRGGGLNYVYQNLSPKSAFGLDLNQKAVDFCNTQYNGKSLKYIQGNAERLPFTSESMDIVINIESSHGYPHMDKFLAEVSRVLKPGGCFLFADFRSKLEISSLRNEISTANLKIISERIITENVVAALDLIHDARESQINKLVPALFRGLSRNFAALKNSPIYTKFSKKEFEYIIIIAQK